MDSIPPGCARGRVDAFSAIVERSPDGHALVGADGTVRYVNPAAVRLLKFDSDVLSGTGLWGAVHGDDRNRIAAWWQELVSSQRNGLAASAHFLRRDGTSHRIAVVATNLLADPEVRAVVVQLRGVDGS